MRLLAAVVVLQLLVVLLVCFLAWHDPLTPTGVTLHGARYLADNFDRLSYLYRGQWAVMGGVPYRSHYSDYPLLMTLYYGLPFLLTREPRLLMMFLPLTNLLWLLLLLAGSVRLARSHLPLAGFWLLPTTAYFVANRFDIIPVALVAAALLLLARRHFLTSAALLALAINVKWYPAVMLLPVLMHLRTQGIPGRALLRFVAVIVVVTLALHAAGWLLAGSASLDPYRFHAVRPDEPAALAGALLALGGDGLRWCCLSPGTIAGVMVPALLTLLFWGAAILLPLRWPARTMPALVAQAAACCLLLIAGSRIYSPQWFLWYCSLAALSLSTRRDTLLLAAVSLASYVRFPVLFDLIGDGQPYAAWSLLIWLLNFLLLARLLRFSTNPHPGSS